MSAKPQPKAIAKRRNTMYSITTENIKSRAIIVAEGIDSRVFSALDYARAISNDIIVFCTAIEEEEQVLLRARWGKANNGIPLVFRCSADAGIVSPLLHYIQSNEYARLPGDRVTVILLRLISPKRWQRLLDNHITRYIERQLCNQDQIAVALLPFGLKDDKMALVTTCGGRDLR